MTDFSEAMNVATSGMKAQATRLRHVSENIANTDTPGYRRKQISFEDAVNGTVRAGPMSLDKTDLPRIYDPTNPMADSSGHFQGSNVNLVVEIADAREAQRSYEANLKIFDQVRKMSTALMDLLRK